MLINNPEALKSWLIVILEPLCDADSSALARYVLALLRKDKPEKELKKVMIEQLDVFLAEQTTPFVNRLFNAISSEEYLAMPTTPLEDANKFSDTATPANSITTATTPTVNTTTTTDVANVIKTEAEQESSTTKLNEPRTSDNPTSSAYAGKTQTLSSDEHKTKEIQSSNQKNNDSNATERTAPAQHTVVRAEHMSTPHAGNSHVRSASPPARVNADKENQPRDSRRRRTSLHSRSRSPRSRSRSNERLSRRSRSRDRRINEREKNQRQCRNKSPPSVAEFRHDRRRGIGGGGLDRRRIGGGGGNNNVLMDDRFGGSGSEGGIVRKGGRNNRSNSRSRSPSLERGRNKGSPGLRLSGQGSSAERSDRHHHGVSSDSHEKRQRCRDFDEKGYCVRGETCPWDHGVNPVVFEGINNSALITMSMREYNPDAPDLWSRSTTAGSIVDTPPVMPTGPSINPFTGVPRPGSVMAPSFAHLDKAANGAVAALTGAAEYARAGVAGAVGGFRAGAPMLPFPFNPAAVTTPLQRELIPIPVVDAGAPGGDVGGIQQLKRRFELEDSVAIAEGPTKRKLPINSRLGPRMPNMQNNCSLELRKVPRGLNTIAHLNNHFAKFGKIVNIQISYDGDPEAAIVTFSTHAEANVAYRSTEAVLNNRFIKVFWHSQDPNTLAAGSGVGVGGVMDSSSMSMPGGRKNSQYHLNNVPAVPTPAADSAKTANTAATIVTSQNALSTGAAATTSAAHDTTTSTTAATAQPVVVATHVPPTSLRLKNNVARPASTGATNASIRKKQEEQAKAVVQLANGLRKRKQELLQNYLKQMKSALELVERCEPNDPQRSKTLETINNLQRTIDNLRKEIAAEQEQIQAQIQSNQPPPPKKTKEQQKKELLDIELELIAQQQEGNDTSAIQKRLEELQRSLGVASANLGGGSNALSGGVAHAAITGGKGSHFSPNTRPNTRTRSGYPEGPTRVDRRPKTIVVTGFTGEEADFVLGHFKHFGEITKHDVDKEIPQLILSYATRLAAEQAVMRGKIFKDKRLQICWAPTVQTTKSAAAHDKKTAAQLECTGPDIVKAITSPKLSPSFMDADYGNDTLPELRLEDEEEDEESEDRSWRR